ncbi:MAG: leucyl aminopeptidase family protein, partial [Woeseiaceae bacterium]
MEYFTTTSKPSKRAVDCVIVGVYERGKLGAGASDIDAASKGEIRKLVKRGDIASKPGRCAMLTNLAGVKADRVAVVGLGKPSELTAKQYRKVVGTAMSVISKTKTRSLFNTLTLEKVRKTSAYYLARHTAESVGNALYQFNRMKSGRKPAAMPLKKVGFAIVNRSDAARVMRGAEHGDAISAGVSLAKDLGNLPANVCTPGYLARTAKKLAVGDGHLTTKILNEAEMKRLGMGSLLSVTAGSKEPAKLIVMQYKGAGKDKPVVLVGKGVTFDTGG